MGVAFLKFHAGGVDVQVNELGHVHPHAFQKFLCLLSGQAAFLDVLFVERIEILIHAAVGDDGAGFLFDAGEHLNKPLALYGLAEGTGRVGRDTFTNFSDFQQLGPACVIFFLRGEVTGELDMPSGPNHDGIAHDDHGFKEGLPVPYIYGVAQIQFGKPGARLIPDINKAALDDLFIVRHPLQGGTVGRCFTDHELGLQPAFIVVGNTANFRRNDFVQMFMVGLAFPVGGDVFHNGFDIFPGDLERTLVTMFEAGQHFAVEVAVDFRVQNAVTAKLPHAARKKLVRRDPHGDLFRHVL